MILKLSLDLPEDRAYVRLIRELGKTTLRHLKVDLEDVEDMEAILDELCSNVIRHAHSEQGRFLVKLIYYADRVVIIVKDKGTGFAFADLAAPGTIRSDFDNQERLGGYGLKIAGALSNRLTFNCIDGRGTTVKAEKQLRYQTLDASDSAKKMDNEVGITAIANFLENHEYATQNGNAR
jgi:serine/threonine-protein kinase RsbW